MPSLENNRKEQTSLRRVASTQIVTQEPLHTVKPKS